MRTMAYIMAAGLIIAGLFGGCESRIDVPEPMAAKLKLPPDSPEKPGVVSASKEAFAAYERQYADIIKREAETIAANAAKDEAKAASDLAAEKKRAEREIDKLKSRQGLALSAFMLEQAEAVEALVDKNADALATITLAAERLRAVHADAARAVADEYADTAARAEANKAAARERDERTWAVLRTIESAAGQAAGSVPGGGLAAAVLGMIGTGIVGARVFKRPGDMSKERAAQIEAEAAANAEGIASIIKVLRSKNIAAEVVELAKLHANDPGLEAIAKAGAAA